MVELNFAFELNYCPTCGTKGSVKKFDDTRYQCQNCLMNFWNNSKTATAVALIQKGQVLVVTGDREHLGERRGRFQLPGGFVSYAENPYDCAVREVEEEVGLRIHDPVLITVYTNGYMPGLTTCDLVFIATKWEGEITKGDDVASFAWKPIAFLDGPDFAWPYHGLAEKLKLHLKQYN